MLDMSLSEVPSCHRLVPQRGKHVKFSRVPGDFILLITTGYVVSRSVAYVSMQFQWKWMRKQTNFMQLREGKL